MASSRGPINEERLLALLTEELNKHKEESRKHRELISANIKAKISEEFGKVEAAAMKRRASDESDFVEVMDRICKLERRDSDFVETINGVVLQLGERLFKLEAELESLKKPRREPGNYKRTFDFTIRRGCSHCDWEGFGLAEGAHCPSKECDGRTDGGRVFERFASD